MVDQYIFSGSLPENASTYVKREADDELKEALLQGKFCYVLNSRQSGKSSLRVRTMSRLSEAGVERASIDLSSINIQTATQENWYADLIVKLIDSFALDVDFKAWWEQNQLNSPLLRFSNFLTKILLAEISENIVIFIDEIDSVLSLNFPTDDFFAFIRSCYNERVDNPQYNRLTFCLLGVASPTSLIQDKNRTPFNIGKAISLKGFQLHEAEPLEKGLQGKFNNPQAVIQEILQWTEGQPFLTQKLCQFMVEESEQDNPCSVEQVVKSRIIENWESQDEPEHLRTIQARILRDEQRAGYLLELYQQVRLAEEQSELTADDTLEQSELQLSGLVVRQQGKLRIYNQIYREIFDFNWIENQLNNLRPYSENFRFWVASGETDESRLLRRKALEEAEEWAQDKNLSYQDKQYLAASKEKEIQEKIVAQEQEAALERERKNNEAVEKRNQVLGEANQKLSEANQKARKRIRIGSIVLVLTLVGAAVSIIWAGKDIQEIRKTTEQISNLSKLSEELHRNNKLAEANQARQQIGSAYGIKNYQLKQAMLLASISYAEQQLQKWNEAKKSIIKSRNFLNNQTNIVSNESLQVQIFVNKVYANLLVKQGNKNEAINLYKEAFDILKKNPNETNPFLKNNQLITDKDVEIIHRQLMNLLLTKTNERKEVETSLSKHLFAGLKYHLNNKSWAEADEKNAQIMLNLAKREKEKYLDANSLNNFACSDLRALDKLWVESDKRFGFSKQTEIWNYTKKKLGINPDEWSNYSQEKYILFTTEYGKAVGWYDKEKVQNQEVTRKGDWVTYEELMEAIKTNPSSKMYALPTYLTYLRDARWNEAVKLRLEQSYYLARRLVKCKI
ncbi:MAG: AAA-like domain-containing protein [Nostoc sp. DedQUE04]|uniref:AAA-like domain-containing protein n=1 Tax=Nostoc sp. DedQUE04 TaxID=3075390 RepID=UPI002AD4F99E|nr:AAA-like domain-containing protein [Nostoc sp. DedQUE04]MDZ8139695.1 AAA-like domain-containing protein [Nostoc sp. DedQUE04]